jgi:hypothetical protein
MTLTSLPPTCFLRHVLLFVCVWLTGSVSAQISDLEAEIMTYRKSPAQLISNGRQLLLDSYLQSDMDKVKELRKYLDALNDSNHIALYPEENRLLMYRTGEFLSLVEHIAYKPEKVTKENIQLPPTDSLLSWLKSSSIFYKPLIEVQLKNAKLPREDEHFLLLYFDYLTKGTTGEEDKAYNARTEEFLKRYPESIYAPYVRSKLMYKEELRFIGTAMEVFMGVNSFTGVLDRRYGSGFAIGNAFDLSFGRVDLYLRNHISFHTKRAYDKPGNGFGSNATSMSFILPEASLGIPFYENHKLKLSAFAGIGAFGMNETVTSGSLVTTYLTGANLNIKLGKNKSDSPLETASYVMLRLRYTYAAPQIKSRLDGESGAIHSFQISLGAKGRGKKRVKM